jgi:hypothetical protein
MKSFFLEKKIRNFQINKLSSLWKEKKHAVQDNYILSFFSESTNKKPNFYLYVINEDFTATLQELIFKKEILVSILYKTTYESLPEYLLSPPEFSQIVQIHLLKKNNSFLIITKIDLSFLNLFLIQNSCTPLEKSETKSMAFNIMSKYKEEINHIHKEYLSLQKL